MNSCISISSSARYLDSVKNNCFIPEPHHPTARKVAIFAATLLAAIAAVGLLGLAGVASFGLIPLSALLTMAVVGGIGSMLCFLKAYWASRTKEDLSFESYVEQKCPGFTVDQAEALADLGNQIIYSLRDPELPEECYWQEAVAALPAEVLLKQEAQTILEKKGELTEEEKETLKRVLLIAVSWSLIQRAFKTGQGFEKGMIKFEDPENELIQFFEPAMYKRASSHYRSTRLSSLGCDFAKGLPYIFKHVHMGSLPDGVSFVKLEQYGCRGEFLIHWLDWVRANVLAKPMGEYDGPNERKEKQIPEAIKKAFSKLCKENHLTLPKMKTVAQMVEWLNKNAPDKASAFNAILDQHFPGQNHKLRSGNEALFMMD
jgi:hypothetical protein